MESLEDQIRKVEAKINECSDQETIKLLMAETIELMKKENRLLAKENQLREEKIEMMKKENLQKEESLLRLREEKVLAVIRVPVDIQLSVALSNSNRLVEIDATMEELVDMTRVVNEAVAFINSEIAKSTNENHRVQPLVFSRLSRGGKTTTLAFVYDRLKSDGKIHPIYISFNCQGVKAFKKRAGETQSQAILRLIAAQLVNCTRDEAFQLVVDRDALDKHLGDNVVLLIDELNRIDKGAPLDADAATLLCEMFLDRAGRHLVFSTHVRIELVDSLTPASALMGITNDPSVRGIKTLNMSLASSIKELQTIPGCKSLTEFQAAYFGYIPSLVNCAIHDSAGSIRSRFYASKGYIGHGLQSDILMRFLHELLTGIHDPLVARYYGHFSSMGIDEKVSYPLCYMSLILHDLDLSFVGVKRLCEIVDKLEVHTRDVGSGLDWECTMRLAIIVRCLSSQWLGAGSPFDIVPKNIKPQLQFIKLSQGMKNLTAARSFINEKVNEHHTHTLLYFDAVECGFEDVEGLVVYTNGLKGEEKQVTKIGFQANSGDNQAVREIDQEDLDHSFLIRARVIAMNPRDTTAKKGWTFWTIAEVKEFLGTSLQLAVPKSMLVDPVQLHYSKKRRTS